MPQPPCFVPITKVPSRGFQWRLLSCLLITLTPTWCCADDDPTPDGTPPDAVYDAAAADEVPLTDYDRRHWSFFPLQPVQPPQATHTDWTRNPIDAFVADGLQQQGLAPQPAATKETLIRRLRFDLTGLPPTVAEIDEFLADNAADAYDRLVDRLLADEGYGERWAQHWLDLARFAETDGFEHDKLRPDAWRYRDWVIQALNDDLPYDEFIRRQLAGDELYPQDESAAVATQFCLAGPDMPDINSQNERRHVLLNELTSTVGAVLLGLQLGCAQCHDHKYDPVSQADFYRLRAVFEPAVRVRKNQSISGLSDQPPFDGLSYVMLRGDFRQPGPVVQPNFPRIANAAGISFDAAEVPGSSGRRTALARWITDPANPLPARVIVNRVWQHHFGVGLSDSPSDFGVMGSEPTHPRLLDWLANWFVDHDWSLKQLHRLIVSSATYRQCSRLPDNADTARQQQWQQSLQSDPDGRLLSRYPRWRLEGEAVRDAMLLAAGTLNRQAGGPGIRPPLPEELRDTLLKNQWDVTPDVSQHQRRSVYVFARRNLRYPLFDVFDRPDANATCPQRDVSTTAPQSLHLLNSGFSFETAEQFAGTVAELTSDPDTQVTQVFRRALGRFPTDRERRQASDFLAATSESAGESQLTHLCLVVFNLNEFVYVD